MDDFQDTKSQYAQLARPEGNSFLTKDLSDVIYGAADKNLFVETHETDFLASMIAIVHKSKEKEFLASYESILENVVVPKSAIDLKQEDKDGHKLFRFVIFQHSVEQYINEARRQSIVCKRFIYNKEQYDEDEKRKTQLEQRMDFQRNNLGQRCYYAFSELFMALMHLKVMRTYIDAVLRFGIPPKFFLGIIEPNKGKDKNIIDAMIKQFAEPSMAEMYGAGADVGDQEDFFPIVLIHLTSPAFL